MGKKKANAQKKKKQLFQQDEQDLLVSDVKRHIEKKKVEMYNNDILNAIQRIENKTDESCHGHYCNHGGSHLFDSESNNSDNENPGREDIEQMKIAKKDIFKLYYEERKREQEALDLDVLLKRVERECYDGFAKEDLDRFVDPIIEAVNKKRIKNMKTPIVFNVYKGGVFDITINEIEDEVKAVIIDMFADDDSVATGDMKNTLSFATCLYDLMEDKYKQKDTTSRKKFHPSQMKKMLEIHVQKLDDITIEYLECIADRYESEADSIRKNNGDEEELKDALKTRDNCLKCITLLKQVDRLKELKRKNAQYKKHVQNVAGSVNSSIKEMLCYQDMEALDDVVDDFYLFLMKKRLDNNERALTFHRADGIFDLKIEEVRGAARFLRKSTVDPQFALMTNEQYAFLIFDQFMKRSHLVQGAGERIKEEEKQTKLNAETKMKAAKKGEKPIDIDEEIEQLTMTIRAIDIYVDENSNVDEDTVEELIATRKTYQEFIKKFRKAEQLKDFSRSVAVEKRKELEDAAKMTLYEVKGEMSNLARTYMLNTTRELLSTLSLMRRQNDKTPLTCHQYGGKFDVTLEEVETALNYLRLAGKGLNKSVLFSMVPCSHEDFPTLLHSYIKINYEAIQSHGHESDVMKRSFKVF